MSESPTASGNGPTKAPRTVRTRNAVLGAAASFVIGVGLGASGTASTPPQGQSATATQTPPPAAADATVAVTAEATAEPTPEATPEPIVEVALAVTVKGSGSQNTKPFDIGAGDFTVVITGSGNSNVIASLVPRGADPFDGEGLFNEISDGKYTYETVVYGVDTGSYYLDMTNANAWTVTFTPLR